MIDKAYSKDTIQRINDLGEIELELKGVLLRLNRLLPKQRMQDLDNIESIIWLARTSALTSLDEVGMARRLLRDV